MATAPVLAQAAPAAATVVRVLAGRLAGAERALTPGRTMSVGDAFWNDIVLRDSGLEGRTAELQLGEDGVVTLDMLTGDAQLLGATVGAGQRVTLPPYVPLRLGGAAIAFGDPSSARWAEAQALSGVATMAGGSEPAAPAAEPPRWRLFTRQAVQRAQRAASDLEPPPRPGGRWLAAGAAFTIAVAGAAGAGPALEAVGLRAGPKERARDALDAEGLRAVTVTTGTDGRLIATGTVPDEAARQRVRRALDRADAGGSLNVQTHAEIARSVADVARLDGFNGEASADARGEVTLHTPPLGPEARSKLLEHIRHDVPAAKSIRVQDDLPDPNEQPIRTIADATKRVSTVVAGEPSYIQTADGARYFLGATLPSGHHLVAIEKDTVVLERNGRRIRLSF